MTTHPALEDQRIGRVTVLFGEQRGKYPYGNSPLVQGTEETLIIDPSLSVIPRHPSLARVDRVLNSHCHEDHIAGNYLFPDVPWHFHEADIFAIHSLDNLMSLYGYGDADPTYRDVLTREFHFTPRPDAVSFSDGEIFDLGQVRIRVIHAPGHTRGHCLFHIEPDDVLYLADIDLSSFGPYYGDAWSSLEDFERTLAAVRKMDARWYATFHHIGVLEGRAAFLDRFDRFAAALQRRERSLLEFLATPATLDDIARHRFLYPTTMTTPWVEDVERHSMSQHVDRLLRDGRLREVEPGRYVAVSA